MKQRLRNIIFYILLIGGGLGLFWFIAAQGRGLEDVQSIVRPDASSSQWFRFLSGTKENFFSPLSILLVQIITIIIAARLLGFVFKKIGQPAVIGEILAGILLGPSLVGHYFPEFFNTLFPKNSLNNLQTISNIGLILFMFVVGMELDMKVLRSKLKESLVISQAGIVFPFVLGMGLAYFLYRNFAPPSVPFLSFALFVGVSMSITAFPVLARIAQERGINKTKLGTVILICAAANDIMAWCILAIIIAIVQAGSVVSSLYTIGFALIYVTVMIKIVRPFLKRISDLYYSHENLNKSVVALFFLVLLLSSFCSELIGIHALFGAFMAGAIMPDNTKFRNVFVDKVEDLALIVFLPLFFVYTGLRTQIGLLNSIDLVEVTLWIVLVAVIGKLAGSALASRYVGRQTWRDSLVIGTLMNTRGLMELVAINIGYDLGVISSEIFVMLVLMALLTTFMTSPMLSLLDKIFPNKEKVFEMERKKVHGIFKALIAVVNPQNGKYLLRVAKQMLDGETNTLEVTALHITAGSDTNPLYGEKYSEESFEGIENEAIKLNVPLRKEYSLSDNVESDIVKIIDEQSFDFMLIGAGVAYSEEPFLQESSLFGKIKWLNKSINSLVRQRVRFYPQTLIKDKSRYFIENSICSVGIFVNRSFNQITETVIVLNAATDGFLLHYARRLLRNSTGAVQITVLDMKNLAKTDAETAEFAKNLKTEFPANIKFSNSHNLKNLNARYNFMLISYQSWNDLTQTDRHALAHIPSTLIINKKKSRFS